MVIAVLALAGCVRTGVGTGLGYVSNTWVPGRTWTAEVHVEEVPKEPEDRLVLGGFLAGTLDEGENAMGALGDGEVPLWVELAAEGRYVWGRGPLRPYAVGALGVGKWYRGGVGWVGLAAAVHAGAGIDWQLGRVGMRLEGRMDVTELSGWINPLRFVGGSVHLLVTIGPARTSR